MEFKNTFHCICNHIEKSFPDSIFILNSWTDIKRNYSSKISRLRSEKSFNSAVKEMVSLLPLSHCGYFSREEVQKMDSQELNSNAPENLQMSSVFTPLFTYIKIPTFHIPWFQFEKAAAVITNPESRALIIDMRLNTGGSLSATGKLFGIIAGGNIPFCITKHFNCPQNAALHIQYPFEDCINQAQAADVSAVADYSVIEWRTSLSNTKINSQQIILLTGPRTYSCGEVFAAIMKETGHGVLIGAKTAGAVLAARDDYHCPDGSRLCLPFADMFSPQGMHPEGTGVIPDIEFNFPGKDTEMLSPSVLLQLLKL